MTKTSVLVTLDDELLGKVCRFQGDRSLSDLLADLILYANRCIDLIIANPDTVRILEEEVQKRERKRPVS